MPVITLFQRVLVWLITCQVSKKQLESKVILMLGWALLFFIFAIVAGIFGFLGIASALAGIAKVLFIVFIVLFIVSLIVGRRRAS